MVKWSMTSRDPQRFHEEVRSAILATAWLLIQQQTWLPNSGIIRDVCSTNRYDTIYDVLTSDSLGYMNLRVTQHAALSFRSTVHKATFCCENYRKNYSEVKYWLNIISGLRNKQNTQTNLYLRPRVIQTFYSAVLGPIVTDPADVVAHVTLPKPIIRLGGTTSFLRLAAFRRIMHINGSHSPTRLPVLGLSSCNQSIYRLIYNTHIHYVWQAMP